MAEFNRKWYQDKGLCLPGQKYKIAARPSDWKGPWNELVLDFVLAEDYEKLLKEIENLKNLQSLS